MPVFARQLGSVAHRECLVAEDGMALVPDRILVAPGDAHLTLERSNKSVVVRLTHGRSSSGCMPSVDPMLASAGAIYGAGALGVVLTGMGRDGVEGAGRMVACGGSVIAQDEASCAVWGMPKGAARRGSRLRRSAARQNRASHRFAHRGAAQLQISDSSSRILAGLLEARTGQQLTMSRRWRIETALSTLMRERGIGTLDELITILVMGSSLTCRSGVIEALLNNETYFFRDRAPFDLLQRYALPELAKRRVQSKRLRIWSAGCSTGQEVYSLAMLFAEEPQKWGGWTIDILGTDVSTSCVDRARDGTYSQFEVQRGLGINQMIKWFEECADGWRAIEQLRKPVRFQVQNILEPPTHPGGFDIVLCRNVLLYLNPEKKTLAFERIASAMAEDGWLMLGAGETVIGQTSKLGADVGARGLYRLVGDGSRVEQRAGTDRRTASGG